MLLNFSIESGHCWAAFFTKSSETGLTLTPESAALLDGVHQIQNIRMLSIPAMLTFSSDPRGHAYKALQGTSLRRRRGSPFSVRVVKYWNNPPASIVTAPFVTIFKKRLEKVWTEALPYLPHRLKIHHHNSLTLPPTARHSRTVPTFICYPNPCFVFVVSLGPLWPTFYHYKSQSLPA